MMRRLQKFFALVQHPRYRHGLKFGVGGAIEHTPFLKNEHFSTILDAGANKGQFALAARAHNPSARIIAFEPLSGPAATFRFVFASDSHVTLLPVALGATAGEQEIHVSRRADSSSLLPIGALQSEIFPGTEESGTETIRVERLADVLADMRIDNPILLKIDVQGFELELLKGAEAVLPRIESIYTELSFVSLYDGQPLAGEVLQWLHERGFNIAGVYNIAASAIGKTVQADFHFRRT